MRSAVQSCVPLQESTAKCCVFFVYTSAGLPRRGLDIGIDGAEKLAFKATEMTMYSQGARRPVACPVPNPEKSQGFLTGFLGYNATGHEGLEGALRATETSCVPLLENQALTMVS